MKDRAQETRHQAQARGRWLRRRLAAPPPFHTPGNQRVLVLDHRLVPDQPRLFADRRDDAPIAEWEEAAEVVHDFVRVETDRLRVVPDEGAGKDPFGPAREVVALEPLPELDADVGQGRDGFQGDAAPFPFPAQARTECFPFGHGGGPGVANPEPGRFAEFPAYFAPSPGRPERSCNRRYDDGTVPVAKCLSFHAAYQCRRSGACCSAGWTIPFDAAELRVVTALTPAP